MFTFCASLVQTKTLLKTCALIALVAFAQIVRAQEDDMGEFKQDDDDMSLEERGNSYSRSWNKGWGGDGGSRGYRGQRGGWSGSRGLGGGWRGNHLGVSNQVVTNKVVPGTVEVAPTVRTESNSVKVVGSVKRRTLQQNSESKVVQNNVVKATDIHVHTNTVIHKPKLVTKVIRRHNTKILINTQPIKTNINIERQQDVIQPEVKNIVVYQNSEQVRRRRLPTIVRNRQQNQRLPTVQEATRNAGTDVIGNPINAGSANLLTLGGLGGGYNGGGSKLGGSYRSGSSRRYRSRKYGNLYKRSGEAVQDEEEAAPAVEEEGQAEEAATN